MKKILLIILISSLFLPLRSFSAEIGAPASAKKLSGLILLQVESRGEAWYVNPGDLKRYFLGRPDDAFSLMKNLGIGITDNNLEKFPIGLDIKIYNGPDTDGDGLSDELEKIIKSDPQKTDTDGDGYEDGHEIINDYNPAGPDKFPIDGSFTRKNTGKIFLQAESKGEAWYINPDDDSRYFLGRPADAFRVMREFGLGIKTAELLKIEAGTRTEAPAADKSISDNTATDAEAVIKNAALAIRSNDKEKSISYFTPNLEKAIRHTMDSLSADSRLTLSNILSGANLQTRNENELIYKNKAYFSLGGYDIPLEFHIKKQSDGEWLMTNL